jgi:hypothetical protein
MATAEVLFPSSGTILLSPALWLCVYGCHSNHPNQTNIVAVTATNPEALAVTASAPRSRSTAP